MTTAHRPTFDPARGKDAQRGPAYHQRVAPAHMHLKQRQAGQGGSGDATQSRDLRAELLKAEARARAERLGKSAGAEDGEDGLDDSTLGDKRRQLTDDAEEEDPEIKRRRLILEQSRAEDADSDSDEAQDDGDDDDDSEESDSDDEDDLMRELAKIKAERAARAQKEEEEKAKKQAEDDEVRIARSNPLLDPKRDFEQKRRWDDDVVFKNQARGTEDNSRKREFTNDLLRSDFHKKFMSRYIR